MTLRSVRIPRPGPCAWASAAAATLFVAITFWWLTQDQGVPGTEPGAQLFAALVEQDMLRDGDLLGPLTYDTIHPPLVTILAAISMLIGGVNVMAPVFGQNLVFVPLLALGCYQVGKLAAGPLAGFLAVVFALGSPLLIEQFHVLMTEAPETALVALAGWLILASDRFRRLGFAAAAGVAVGAGIEVKQQFPFFVAGLLLVVLLRGGGWRNWRGIGVFALAVVVVGSPWYLVHLDDLHRFTRYSVGSATPGTLPPLLSLTNLGWYLWALLNGVLFAPLFAFAAIGVARATAGIVRRRPTTFDADIAPELLGGALVSWIALLATPIHTVRYAMPAVFYFAVLGTAWIVRLRPSGRAIAIGLLGLAVVASTLGASFGVGGRVRVMLTSEPVSDRSVYGVASPRQIVFHSDDNFLVSGPRRGGEIQDLMHGLERGGMIAIAFLPNQERPDIFERNGLHALAQFAGLGMQREFNPGQLAPGVALLVRQRSFGSFPPCIRLSDGSGVWVRFGRAVSPRTPHYCPLRRPAFYGP
jgi:4-amino-4-deoxy-L-arabinose transferase-like glycosyltransferase